MPAFLFYLAGRAAGVSLDDCRATGLGYALRRGCSRRGVTGGPGGGGGVVVADEERVPSDQVGYFPDRQVWRPLVDAKPAGSVWVGYAKDAPPGPADLLRDQPLRGHEVTLLDGRNWLVPIARGWIEQDGDLRWYCNLPEVLDLDAEGKWKESKVLPRLAHLWDLALRWDDARSGATVKAEGDGDGGKTTALVEFDQIIDGAVTALAANYCLGRTEVAMLGLLSTATAAAVLDALADVPTRRAWCKKKLTTEATTAPEG